MFVFFKLFNSNTNEYLQQNIQIVKTYKMFWFKNILLTIRTRVVLKEIRREPWVSFKIIWW